MVSDYTQTYVATRLNVSPNDPAEYHTTIAKLKDQSSKCRGEKDLFIAILETALEDLEKPIPRYRTHPSVKRDPAVEALRWFLTPESDWPASAQNICEILNISYSNLIKAILKRHARLLVYLKEEKL